MATLSLPEEFTPFRELYVCSNRFLNGKAVIGVKTQPVLLVGRGAAPVVWIAAALTEDGSTWRYIVERNQVRVSNLGISVDAETTTVGTRTGVILQARTLEPDKAEIVQLDLRPLGINVHGSISALYVGTESLVRNKFENTDTMIGLG